MQDSIEFNGKMYPVIGTVMSKMGFAVPVIDLEQISDEEWDRTAEEDHQMHLEIYAKFSREDLLPDPVKFEFEESGAAKGENP